MTVATARSYVRQFARNAGDSSVYSDTDIDRAIQVCCNDFISRTRCTPVLSTVELVSGTSQYDTTTAISATFRPERILSAWVTTDTGGTVAGRSDPLLIVPFADLWRVLTDENLSGAPDRLAFAPGNRLYVYPKPDADYDLMVFWYEPLSSWTLGDAGSTTLNIPDEYLHVVLAYGASSVLQHHEPQNAYAQQARLQYDAFVARLVQAGSLGTQTMDRHVSSE